MSETGGSYPDLELLPAIANYFGVSIDELFGYASNRETKIAAMEEQLRAMIRQNNGVDVNITECITLAREALLEFPSNERLMCCLAAALYQAGYVRHGERHFTDAEGYSRHDTLRHQEYAEWAEAIRLYEKALPSLTPGPLRHEAVDQLSQLYLNTGAQDKARALAQTAPGLWGSRPFLMLCAHDGKDYAAAVGRTLLSTVCASAELCVHGVLAAGQNLTPAEKAQSLRCAIGLFGQLCPDGQFGTHHAFLGKVCMLLSMYLWLDGQPDAAFAALEDTLQHFRRYEALCHAGEAAHTAPLVRLIRTDMSAHAAELAADRSIPRLPEDWPWWSVEEADQVRREMQSDPRWAAWAAKTQE